LQHYARGMSTRDIQRHIQELYCIEISSELVSAVTDSVIEGTDMRRGIGGGARSGSTTAAEFVHQHFEREVR
jgi:hypothetical protein